MKTFATALLAVTLFSACNKDVNYGARNRKKEEAPATQKQNLNQSPAASTSPTPTDQPAGPVQAVLSGTPAATSSENKLDVTVSGTNVKEYQFVVLSQTNSCANAQYGEWRPVSQKIDTPLTVAGVQILCVKGRTDASNPQTNPTTHQWIQQEPPILAAALSNLPKDGNTTENLKVIVGGVGITEYSWVVVPGGGPCPTTPPENWKDISHHITDNVSQEGKYRLCVTGRSATGQRQVGYTEHTWTQGRKPPPPPPENPTPEHVRIDLVDLKTEAWSKVCLYVSGNRQAFKKIACNKQDSDPATPKLEFKADASKCVSLEFRLEVFPFTSSCAGIDPEACPTAATADPIRLSSSVADARFFQVLSAETITPDLLRSKGILMSDQTDQQILEAQKKASAYLAQAKGAQSVRLYAEDQSDANMDRFEGGESASATGIDFNDFVINIRTVDVGFAIPGQDVDCKPQPQ